MNDGTLQAFNGTEFAEAHLYLATQVAEMMGRKFEEGDWAKIYCVSKGIPISSWSNLSIDVMHGNIGIEHKMICRRQDQTILEACGTTIMHPAGTRSIRIPAEEDATKAARIVLEQYVELIHVRSETVRILHSYQHSRMSTDETLKALQTLGMSPSSAKAALPKTKSPVGLPDAAPDMRIGWLLWKENLSEFLYFEERMAKPNPNDFVAEWRDSGGGRRKKSRNLWVYHKETKEKVYSITTEAGAKIQPYFRVPLPDDENLYHFVVQGEECGNGMMRVWLTRITANLLRESIGDLRPEAIAAAVNGINFEKTQGKCSSNPFDPVAVEIIVPCETYSKLKEMFKGVSDEHNFRQLVEELRSR